MGEVLELRQYTLRPGQRDVLIELFDREFVETQEAEGMAILGQFRDLDRPDRFVWLRGFPDISTRAAALTAFYTGPAWREHAAAANATMIDSDDVLLLRPVRGFPPFPAPRPSADTPSIVLATICLGDRPFDDGFFAFFADMVVPALAEAGGRPLAWYSTEYAENDFPALPVRTGEHAFVWFARFPSVSALDKHTERSQSMPETLTIEHLRLSPTTRSMLR
jgi:hypothetical protein